MEAMEAKERLNTAVTGTVAAKKIQAGGGEYPRAQSAARHCNRKMRCRKSA